jgi:hypothetical protein
MQSSLACRSTQARGPALVPAAGTARRLQALAWMAHPASDLANALGAPEHTVRRLQSGRITEVTPQLAAAVAALYDQLWDVQGDSPRTCRAARRYGWAPALAWDEDSPGDPGYDGHGIDDPDAVPAPNWRRPRQTPRADRRADLIEVAGEYPAAMGPAERLRRAAERLGMAVGTAEVLYYSRRLREPEAVAS